jgi:hypothetical protein
VTRWLTPALLLAKTLQYVEVHQDLLSPERFGPLQYLERLHRKPSLHSEDHDLMQPHAGGVELGLEVGGAGFDDRRSAMAQAPSEKSSSCRRS